MTLQDLSLAAIAALYNTLDPAQAVGPKTFKSKAYAIGRLRRQLAERGVDETQWLAGVSPAAAAQTEEDVATNRNFVGIVNALLMKTVDKGCTPDEELEAVRKARELIAAQKLNPLDFTFPPDRTKKPTAARRPEPAKPAPKPAAKPAAKKDDGPRAKSVRIIRVASEELLLRANPPMSYEEILEAVLEEFPDANTTVACLRWYAVQMRERGERVPTRPRKRKPKTEKAA